MNEEAIKKTKRVYQEWDTVKSTQQISDNIVWLQPLTESVSDGNNILKHKQSFSAEISDDFKQSCMRLFELLRSYILADPSLTFLIMRPRVLLQDASMFLRLKVYHLE